VFFWGAFGGQGLKHGFGVEPSLCLRQVDGHTHPAKPAESGNGTKPQTVGTFTSDHSKLQTVMEKL